jgi:hypothetical protein
MVNNGLVKSLPISLVLLLMGEIWLWLISCRDKLMHDLKLDFNRLMEKLNKNKLINMGGYYGKR